jgi:hypothetical protein
MVYAYIIILPACNALTFKLRENFLLSLPLSLEVRNFMCPFRVLPKCVKEGARFEVLIAVAMKIDVSWDAMPCILVDHYQRFRATSASISKLPSETLVTV